MEFSTKTESGSGPQDPVRRMMVSALGAMAGALVFNKGALAQENDGSEEEVFNAYNRTRSFEKNEMDSGTPWVAPQLGGFDLADPVQSNLAKFKMTNNLVGARTYIPMLVRLMIGREQYPGGRLLGAAGLFTWQLQVPDPAEFPDAPEGTILSRSMYTSTYLNPETMEPQETLLNPYNDKMMVLEDQRFIENFLFYPKGGALLYEEPQFVNDDPDVAKVPHIKDWGDELVLFMGGVYNEPGIHQPRFTENMWASPKDEVMDPDVEFVDTRYTFTGLNKAYEKPWAGYTTADNDIICDLAYGKKVHSVEALPDFHKRVLAEKYPNRL